MYKKPTTFSIKDLENLSGIKAHTIRMWEKRYNILVPERTTTNIRLYNFENLQKLLNITLLYNSGIKISKLGKLSSNQLKEAIQKLADKKCDKDYFLDELKLSMFSYDQFKFKQTYKTILEKMSFREAFLDIFIPFLEILCLQWLCKSISTSHEHFITSLITQKLLINIDLAQSIQPDKSEVYVLFLPDDEIHEMGLMYLNYELSKAGYQTIYLGPSVPLESLETVIAYYPDVSFISYFTVSPTKSEVNTYLEEIDKKVLSKNNLKLNILGRNAQAATLQFDRIKVFNNLSDLLNKLV